MTTTSSPQNQQQNHAGSCCKTTHDEVARAAFCLYEKRGAQDGHDVRNWLDAEAHVKSKYASAMHEHQTTDKVSVQSAR